MNKHTTLSMFVETQVEGIAPEWTCKETSIEIDGKVYRSMKQRYIELSDPTEHAFVQDVFDGDWKLWHRVQNSSTLRVKGMDVNAWRIELEIKLRAKGIAAIITEIDTDGKSAFQAAKWLADAGWKLNKTNNSKGAGRPKKDEAAQKRAIANAVANEIDDDARRLGLQ